MWLAFYTPLFLSLLIYKHSLVSSADKVGRHALPWINTKNREENAANVGLTDLEHTVTAVKS